MTPAKLRALADEATPGPWHIENPGIDGADAIGGILLGHKDKNGTYDDFIETDGGFYGPQLRNARLIALAPDLARLCAEMGEALAFWLQDDFHEPAIIESTADSHALILAKLSELETPDLRNSLEKPT